MLDKGQWLKITCSLHVIIFGLEVPNVVGLVGKRYLGLHLSDNYKRSYFFLCYFMFIYVASVSLLAKCQFS
jgi:hypothetical protein